MAKAKYPEVGVRFHIAEAYIHTKEGRFLSGDPFKEKDVSKFAGDITSRKIDYVTVLKDSKEIEVPTKDIKALQVIYYFKEITEDDYKED